MSDSRIYKTDIHKSPDGFWRRCIAQDCPYGDNHTSIRSLAISGGSVILPDGHSKSVHITKVYGEAFAVAGGQRSRTYRLDGTRLSPVEARAWRRKHDLDLSGLGGDTPNAVAIEPDKSKPQPFSEYAELFELMNADTEQWLERPWKERKQIIEVAQRQAIREVERALLAENGWSSAGQFAGWNRRTKSLGITRTAPWKAVPDIELSQVLLRHRGPKEVFNTILHEIGHAVSPYGASHGITWRENFRIILDHFGLKEEEVHQRASAYSEAEKNAFRQRELQKRWVGICPNNPEHRFYQDGKPRHFYKCAKGDCADAAFGSARLTYIKNPDYKP